MITKSRLLNGFKKYQFQFSIAAIALYNNWLLGFFLNPQAMLAGATTSELGASGQPWNGLFRILDIVAGLLFLLGAGAVVSLATTKRLRATLLFAVLVLGVSTIVESFIPLNCSSALDKICSQKERLGLLSWQNNFHMIESVVSYALLSLFPLIILQILRFKSGFYLLKKWSYVLIAFMVLWAIDSYFRYSHKATSYGFEQRMFIVIFSYWYFQTIQLSKRRPGSKPSPEIS